MGGFHFQENKPGKLSDRMGCGKKREGKEMRKYRCQTTCWCSGPLPRGWALKAHPPPRGPRDGAGLDIPGEVTPAWH